MLEKRPRAYRRVHLAPACGRHRPNGPCKRYGGYGSRTPTPIFWRLTMRSRWHTSAVSLALGLCIARAGHAQNIDRFYLSGDAALQGGAITADSRGGGGIWYNPAALAKLPHLRLDASMSAYALGFGGESDLDGASDQAKVTRLTSLDLRGVPAGMSITHNAGRFGIGFGLFVPTQTSSYLRTHIQDPKTAGSAPVDFGVDVTSTELEYFGGPSLGVALSSRVDFGVSLLVHYRSELEVAAVGFALGEPTTPDATILTHTTRDWVQVGLEPVVGTQMRLTPNLRLGITLRFPSFRLYQVLQTLELGATSVAGSSTYESRYADGTGFGATMVKPPRIHFGLSHDDGPNRIALELSYQFPFWNPEVQQDLRPLPNARLGGRRRISDTLAIGGGIFTNLSARRAPKEFGEKQINYYGFTVAADMGTPYEIRKRDGRMLTPYGRLNFGATLALTYSIGLGNIMRAQVGLSDGAGEPLRVALSSVIAHEIMLSLGSSLEE